MFTAVLVIVAKAQKRQRSTAVGEQETYCRTLTQWNTRPEWKEKNAQTANSHFFVQWTLEHSPVDYLHWSLVQQILFSTSCWHHQPFTNVLHWHVTNSIHFYSCVQLRAWQKLERKVFLKKQTFICLFLPKIRGLKLQEFSKAGKKRILREAR